MSLLPVFKWLGATSLGMAINRSTYGFAIIEMVHLLGLSLLGGSVLIIDLCALGWIRLRQPAARIASDLTPLLVGSLAAMVASGVLLVADGPLRYYANAAFRAKMLLLGVAVVFYFTLHRRALAGTAAARKAAALVALALWLGVGLAGRAIGLL
ncbi:MAG TPA: DUF6644 family protein [Steroidobacteraceae bacterium]|nr:DUF6644 family protein [Steroidobacteraceae bacterium]